MLSFFSIEILQLTTPEAYWPAASVTTFLVMGLVLQGTTQVTVVGISLERRTNLLATASWITAISNLLLNWFLIPRLGAIGAGIATFLSYSVLTCLYLYWTQKLHPIPLNKRKLLFSAFTIIFCMGVSTFLNSPPLKTGMKWILLKMTMSFVIFLSAFFFRIFVFSDLVKVFNLGEFRLGKSNRRAVISRVTAGKNPDFEQAGQYE